MDLYLPGIITSLMEKVFLSVAQNYIRPNGLYLLDEPEAAISAQKTIDAAHGNLSVCERRRTILYSDSFANSARNAKRRNTLFRSGFSPYMQL